MSKELDYIADLERENRTLKSILYCTKRSCNNCGKVNCENFQRQRTKYCENWVSYKDYITELEKENAELRNNGFTVSAMTEQQLKVALKKGEQLEKENAELKEKREQDCDSSWYEGFNCSEKERLKQLTKAIEIIKELLDFDFLPDIEIKKQAEQFLKEIKK